MNRSHAGQQDDGSEKTAGAEVAEADADAEPEANSTASPTSSAEQVFDQAALNESVQQFAETSVDTLRTTAAVRKSGWLEKEGKKGIKR